MEDLRRRVWRMSVPVAACGLLAWTAAVRSQTTSQRPTFQAGVDVVQVDVSVLDQNRRPVRGLTAADFSVLVDGKKRPIVAFAPVELPERDMPSAATAAWARVAPRDVVTNAMPAEGRLVVIM